MHFSTKQLQQYQTVAELLATARQGKDIDLDRAEKQLRISKKYLVALEQGQYHKLPGDLYVRNFVRAYAAYLGADQAAAVALAERELDITKKIAEPEQPSTVNRYTGQRTVVTPHTLRQGLIGVLVLACLGYFGWQLNAIFSPPRLTVNEPAEDIATAEGTIIIRGQTEPEAQVFINQQSILADPAGAFVQQVDLQTGLNTITVTAQKKRGRPAKIVRQVIVERPDETTPLPAGELIELPPILAPQP